MAAGRAPWLAALALVTVGAPGWAQTARPTPAPKAPAKPAAAPAADVRFTTTYTTGEALTESVTYLQGRRERYDLGDMILLRQRDQKRVIQISRAANAYLVSPEWTPVPPPSPGTAPTSTTRRGVVMMATSIVDTGERKDAFGRQARHVKTMIDRHPQTGACDPSRLRIETDGWYIDLPKAIAPPAPTEMALPAGAGCDDELITTHNGDPLALGFPISYRTTITDLNDKKRAPLLVSMDVTAFDVLRLDPALFEIPRGMTAMMNPQELARAISDANEAALATPPEAAHPVSTKDAGDVRVGVPELANATPQSVDTRALRAALIAALKQEDIQAIPMAAGARDVLDARATALALDYLLIAEITELKASRPAGLTKLIKKTAGETTPRDITEAKLSVQLVSPRGPARLTKTTTGKDGGLGLKTGVGVAKMAGGAYLRMMTFGLVRPSAGARQATGALNVGAMGLVDYPSLARLQSLGDVRSGMGADRTAGAASFLMQQAILGDAMESGGPSFDAALDDAIHDAGKQVAEALKKTLKK